MTREEFLAHMYMMPFWRSHQTDRRLRFVSGGLTVYLYNQVDECEIYIYSVSTLFSDEHIHRASYDHTLELVKQTLEKESQEAT